MAGARAALISAAFLGLVACGGPGSFNGTVGGYHLSVEDAVFLPVKDVDGKTYAALLFMADRPDVCSLLKANREASQATYFASYVWRSNPDGTYLSPDVAEYTVMNPDASQTATGLISTARFAKYDANCMNVLMDSEADGLSGLVKVTEYKQQMNGRMSGTFDVTFGTQGDRVTGSFSASYCDAPTFATLPNCE